MSLCAAFRRQVREALADTFRSLRHRNFRYYWLGQLPAATGRWMYQVAQGWLVLQLDNSALVLGTVGALQWLPVLLLTVVSGAIAERYPKRSVLLVTQSLLMTWTALLGILTVTGLVKVWHVMVIAFLTGLVNAFDQPTRQSFVVELVGRDDLPNGIALNSSLFNTARVVGPSLGGFIIKEVGIGPTFLIDAAAYLPFIAGLLVMRDLPLPRSDGRRVGEQVVEGLRYIRTTPDIFWPIALVGVVSLFSINWNVLLPLMAKNVLKLGADGLGLLYGALGIGSLAGSLHMARDHRPFTTSRVALYALLFTVFEALAAAPSRVEYVMVLLAAAGYYSIRFTSGSNALVQINVPDHLRLRVMSVYYLVFGGSSPFGNELVGAMAHVAGPRGALLLSSLIGGAFALWVLGRDRRAHEEANSGAP